MLRELTAPTIPHMVIQSYLDGVADARPGSLKFSANFYRLLARIEHCQFVMEFMD